MLGRESRSPTGQLCIICKSSAHARGANCTRWLRLERSPIRRPKASARRSRRGTYINELLSANPNVALSRAPMPGAEPPHGVRASRQSDQVHVNWAKYEQSNFDQIANAIGRPFDIGWLEDDRSLSLHPSCARSWTRSPRALRRLLKSLGVNGPAEAAERSWQHRGSRCPRAGGRERNEEPVMEATRRTGPLGGRAAEFDRRAKIGKLTVRKAIVARLRSTTGSPRSARMPGAPSTHNPEGRLPWPPSGPRVERAKRTSGRLRGCSGGRSEIGEKT
jgi:hypothetical protein